MKDHQVISLDFANLYVERIKVRNFRGLTCDIHLEQGLTLLVGRNNAGKSRVLRAIAITLGGVSANADDFTVDKAENPYIDVFVAPSLANEAGEEEFEPRLQEIMGAELQQISLDPSRQRFAWRTTLERSREGLGARSKRSVLSYTDSPDGGSWSLRDNPPRLSSRQGEVLEAVMVSDNRDLDEELRRPGSSIRRILSDLAIDEDDRQTLENDLAKLGQLIVSRSATLKEMAEALERMQDRVGGFGEPSIHAVPSRLGELARWVSVEMNTGSGRLPARFHGSGTKSLASLQLQGVFYKHRLGQDGDLPRPHPVTLIEEPEAHLHPQAIFELPGLVETLSGQVIASTHSGQLVSASCHRAVRILQVCEGETRVVDLHPVEEGTEQDSTPRGRKPNLYVEEIEKLKRQVERPFGELLFAQAIVMGDGATERAFLPVMLRHALQSRADSISVVDPGSMGSSLAKAVVKFACLIDIPWFLFADSDSQGRAAAEGLVSQYAKGQEACRVVWVNGETSHPDDQDETKGAKAIENMLITWDEELCREACLAIRPDLDQLSTDKLLNNLKGSVGGSLGNEFSSKYPDTADWPLSLQRLVQLLKSSIWVPGAEE